MISKLGFYHIFLCGHITSWTIIDEIWLQKKLFLIFLSTANAVLAPHRAITLVGKTFVARLIYYCPIHSFWPGDILLQPGYNHYCQSIITEKFWTVIERVIVQTNSRVALAVCNNNLIAKYSNRWNFYPPLLVCCWSTILQPAPHWSGNFTAKFRVFAALCDGGFVWLADSESLMSILRKEESQPHIALHSSHA